MIYLHVPFCGSFCTYCDFYSEIAPACDRKRFFQEYADAVLFEIGARREEIRMNRLAVPSADTLYIGGGTPSVLPLEILSLIVTSFSRMTAVHVLHGTEAEGRELLPQGCSKGELTDGREELILSGESDESRHQPVCRKKERSDDWRLRAPKLQVLGTRPLGGSREAAGDESFDCEFAEFTVEVNPEDIVEKGADYVRGLLKLGVNRISMGVQSFDDGMLRWMNRRHDAARAGQAYDLLRTTATECRKPLSVSIDLIFGITGLSDAVWNDTISRALSLGSASGFPPPEHISAYQLSIEEGSVLGRMVAEGRYTEVSEDDCRRQYDLLCHRLTEAGYRHYEISNFAFPGREAVHNGAYWRRVPYVGLGPGAHSFRIDAGPDGTHREVRAWNGRTLPRRMPDGQMRTYSSTAEVLSAEDIRIERLMLGLRTAEGLPRAELLTLADPAVLGRLLAEGALELCGNGSFEPAGTDPASRIRIPESHFFTADEILRELV